MEFRNGGILSAKNDVSEHYIGHELDLSQGETALFKSFRESTRRNIKKSQKMGVSVVLANTGEQMEQYYRLHCLTRKKHGLPPQPKQFFDKI